MELRRICEGQIQRHAAEQERFDATRIKECKYLRRSLDAMRNAELAAEGRSRSTGRIVIGSC